MLMFFLLVFVVQSLRNCVALHVFDSAALSQIIRRENALAQAEQLFQLTTRLNDTDYFTDYRVCLTNSAKPLTCMKYVNNYQKQFVKLWSPRPDATEVYPRFEQDCSYGVTFVESAITPPMYVQYSFMVKQGNCISQTNLIGGASFDSFGLSQYALASCSTIDLLDNQYNITCILPAPSKPQYHPICFNLTVLLMYEHFDAVSEVLLDWSHKYPPMRSVLVNNQQFCAPSDRSTIRPANQSDIQPAQVFLPPDVRWFTGMWVQNHGNNKHAPLSCTKVALPYNHTQCFHSTAYANFEYNHVPGSVTDAYTHSLFINKTHILPPLNTSRLTFPPMAGERPSLTADKYSFQTTVYTGKPTEVSSLSSAVYSYDYCLAQGFNPDLCADSVLSSKTTVAKPTRTSAEPYNSVSAPLLNITSTLSIHESLLMRNITTDVHHIYHFIGASHMRYNFDAVCEYYLGVADLEGVSRKHDSLTHHNLKYDFVSNSKHQTEFLQGLCHSLQNNTVHGQNMKYTIIFETGAWDLSMASLRRAIKDPYAMARLMAVFESIFDGSLECGGLVEILFLTALPHAICFDDSNWRCNAHRSYRTNTGVEALNTFLISNMLRISQLPYHARNTRTQSSDNTTTANNHNNRQLAAIQVTTRTQSTAFNRNRNRDITPIRRFKASNKEPTSYKQSKIVRKKAKEAPEVPAIRVPDGIKLIQTRSKYNNNPSSTLIPVSEPLNITSIRLSMIDTFAIVHPRLLFNELSETACLNHYTCRVYINPLGKTVLLQTPAGAAVVKSILTALSISPEK